MRHALRYALRFLVLVAVALSLSALYDPSPAARGPYGSALSMAAFPPVRAAFCKTHCQNHSSCVSTNMDTACHYMGPTCVGDYAC